MMPMDLGNRIEKKIEKEKKEIVDAQAKWKGGFSQAPVPSTAGARSRPFSGRFPSICFQRMVLVLKNRIEKKSKRKTKKWCTHRQNGGGVTNGLDLAHFPFKLRQNAFQLWVSVYRTEPSQKKSKKKAEGGGHAP